MSYQLVHPSSLPCNWNIGAVVVIVLILKISCKLLQGSDRSEAVAVPTEPFTLKVKSLNSLVGLANWNGNTTLVIERVNEGVVPATVCTYLIERPITGRIGLLNTHAAVILGN